jgi:hypothetical protein
MDRLDKCSALTYSGAVDVLAKERGTSGAAALASAREDGIDVDAPLDVEIGKNHVAFLAASSGGSESEKNSIGLSIDTVEHRLSRALGVKVDAARATVAVPMGPVPPGLSRYFQDGLRACAQNGNHTTAARLRAASERIGAK